MRFEDFLKEADDIADELASHSQQLATTAKSTDAELAHDRGGRRHRNAADKRARAKAEEAKETIHHY